MTLKSWTEQQLERIEKVRARRLTRRKRHKDVFEKDQADEEEDLRLVLELREKYAADCPSGPPAGWQKTATPAQGMAFKIEVQFKGGDPTYDPTKLPAVVLQAPGIVKTIDVGAVQVFVAPDQATLDAIANAFVPVGPWQRPTVLVKPLT